MTAEHGRQVKCVVWDLDHTLWEGILVEDPNVRLRPAVRHVIEALDQRGILQSIASKNDRDLALGKLHELGIGDYFLYPQIGWSSKSSAVRTIAKSINIGVDTLAFVDDQAFEREEVKHAIPEVLCLDAAELDSILGMPEMTPRSVTEDTKLRRLMYQQDSIRQQAEEAFVGPAEEFLATLQMRFRIARANEEDLQRAEELTVRTNQLNTTGYMYSYEELNRFRVSDHYLLLIASLTDRFGAYGRIGLALVEKCSQEWTLKLLLMSCRVISRGVGTVLLASIMREARAAGVVLRAEFVPNGRNRTMYVTYRLANFREVEKRGDIIVLENCQTERIPAVPAYIDVETWHEAVEAPSNVVE